MRKIFDRKIILENGMEFLGYGFGCKNNKVTELVFNTSMVGYQEIISDPSYTYQSVIMTYPLIGNYGINDFDFEYQPTINKNQILDLASLRFIEDKSNIIFVGTSGVGKTHLATSIGIEAASQRVSTYFINFAILMEKIKKAAQENRLEQIIRHYMKYTLLIIDEIGYLPVDKDSSYGFFQLIASRYEKKPTILTTNQPFSKWPDIFGNSVIANAIIDRLVHHCDIVKITGQSYRIKGRRIFDDQDE